MKIDLLKTIKKIKRNTKKRAKNKTIEQVNAALKFGWEYFDKKGICYNGYTYDGRWIPVVKRFIDFYKLKKGNKILDLGCAKGYLLYDFYKKMPSLDLYGIDISKYAIACAPPEVKKFIKYGNAINLSRFPDNYFDLVIAINTIHSFKTLKETEKAVSEIQRVTKKNSYIVVDSYKTQKEKIRMEEWQVAGHLVISEKEWLEIFKKTKFTGDYYWFKP